MSLSPAAAAGRPEDVRQSLRELLISIRPAAERAGVQIALEVPGERLLPSAMEVRELIDAGGSWVFGACVDLDRAGAAASDWLLTLGRRVFCVRVRAEAALEAVGESLRDIGFEGEVLRGESK